MTDEIEQLLKNLKLGRMRSIYDEQLRAAEKQQVSYSEFVAALLARSGITARRALWSGAFAAHGRLVMADRASNSFNSW